jgi:hypothetical protein
MVPNTIFYSNNIFKLICSKRNGRRRVWWEALVYADKLEVGRDQSYMICGSNNQLLGWGNNDIGQLGDNTVISTTSPVSVLNMTNTIYHSVGTISGAIKTDSTAWVWGNFGDGFNSLVPTLKLSKVKSLNMGHSHAVFVKYDGTVWAMGNNTFGQIGNGTTSSTAVSIPVQMLGITNAVRAIAVGGNFGVGSAATVILLADGTVKIAGASTFVGGVNSVPTPQLIPGLNNVVDIKGNDKAVYALKSNGEVFSFGLDDGTFGVLGYANCYCRYYAPTKINFPTGAGSIIAISANAGGTSGFALDENGNLYSWGTNFSGNLGDGTTTNRMTPLLVASNVKDINSGVYFSYLVKNDNTLWATGRSGPTGSIWMNLSNTQRLTWTQINQTIAPMNLCPLKPFGVLPVKLTAFTAVKNNKFNLLSWQTASEQNSRGFELQRSHNGLEFTAIATIPTQALNGNSTSVLNYRFTDREPRKRRQLLSFKTNR